MNRKISVERTYALRQYENLKLYDEIEVPEEMVLDDSFVESVRQMQFVHLELMYRRYVKLAERLLPLNQEDAINALFELRENLNDKIKEQLKKEEKEND